MHRFVVGSGRCGSTLLSRMLAECPSVLSVFELFNGLDMATRFDPAPIDGATIAELLGREQPFVTAVLRRGYRVEEITYPFADGDADEGGAGRRRAGDPLPWILVSMLPRLSTDPDALYEDVMAFLRSAPRRPPRDHYLGLFGWLGERQGRPLWIERSGSSIDYAGDLVATFPDAHFVHIHRDGPEVALSMREHHAYRLPISLLYDAPLDGGARVSSLPPLDFDSAPAPDDTISRILAARPPAEFFGRYWSDQIGRGVPALASLPRERVLTVRFEELVRRPGPVLDAIAGFLALPGSGGWIDRAADLVRGVPRQRLDDLDGADRARLLDACAPGRALLGD